MDPWALGVKYSGWALEFILLPPIAIFQGAFAVLLVRSLWSGDVKSGWRLYHWLFLTHILFFAAAIAIGVYWHIPDPRIVHPRNIVAEYCLNAMLFGSLASCLFWIWHMHGFRSFAVGMMGTLELMTLGAVMVAGMSISGDWL